MLNQKECAEQQANIIRGPKLEALNIHINYEIEEDFMEKFNIDFSNKEIKKKQDCSIMGKNTWEKSSESKELKISELDSKQQEDIIISNKTSMKKSSKTSRGIYLINVFKRAKNFAGKIKRNLFYKNYKNMKNFHRKVVNDLTDFPVEFKQYRLKVFILYFFLNDLNKLEIHFAFTKKIANML